MNSQPTIGSQIKAEVIKGRTHTVTVMWHYRNGVTFEARMPNGRSVTLGAIDIR